MQPLLNRYKMAFTTSRRATVIGAPHPVEPGISGAINAHWSSVRSLGYAARVGWVMVRLRFGSRLISAPTSAAYTNQLPAPLLRKTGTARFPPLPLKICSWIATPPSI